MEQLLLHLWGDYIFQSDWMAQRKTSKSLPCLFHCYAYASTFFLIASWRAVLVIFVTHFLIDRFGLARYVIRAKNRLFCSPHHRWWQEVRRCDFDELLYESYPDLPPAWLTTWLLIIADNTLHLTINFLAIRYL